MISPNCTVCTGNAHLYSQFHHRHTSGTTGVPKPIIWTHETCALAAAAKNEEAPKTTSTVEGLLLNGKRIVVTLPPFHVCATLAFNFGRRLTLSVSSFSGSSSCPANGWRHSVWQRSHCPRSSTYSNRPRHCRCFETNSSRCRDSGSIGGCRDSTGKLLVNAKLRRSILTYSAEP